MITDEQLAAFADDQLNGDEKARVKAAIAADPALAAKVESHRALKTQLSEHYAPTLDQAVPDHLTAMLKKAPTEEEIATAEVLSFAKEREKRGLATTIRRWAPIAGPALAACLVVAIMQPWQISPTPDGYADSRLAGMLDTQLTSAQGADASERILLSFENGEGQYCRAYQNGVEGGIACRDTQGWAIERAFVLEQGQTTEFRQAGSLGDVMALAQDMAAGAALDPDAEAKAREKDWFK